MIAPAVEIRSFRDGDAAGVVALWRQVFDDAHVPQREPQAIVARRRVMQPELFVVAADGAAIVGAVLGGYDGHRAWMYRLAVASTHRRGLGRALVQEVEGRLRALGCSKINLQVEAHNRDVVAFYERLGWAVEERIALGKRV